MTEPQPPTHVVLVGLMGTGKTTVGRRVARTLGWPMSDSDASIEASEGRTARTIRDTDGVDAIHELEYRHLLSALAGPGPVVVCPAASVVDDEACREALNGDGILVAWLTARPETAAARFDDQAHRPRYGDDPLTFLAEQATRRDPWFREIADLVLETDDATPDELAAAIVVRVRA